MPILLPENSMWSTQASRGEHGRVARVIPGEGAASPRRWALLADTHLSSNPEAAYLGNRTLDNTLRTIEQAAAAKPDGAIVNGDVAWMHGLPQDYGRVAETLAGLAAEAPVLLTPGNHDRRDHMLRRFHPEGFGVNEPAKLISVVDTPIVRFILLDSLYRTDVVPGLLGEAQRTWLASFLDAEDPAPTVVFVHHPPGEDDGALLDGDKLLEILQPRRQVKALFTAHDHVWRTERRGRLHLVGLPSAAFAFTPEEPVGWVEAEFCSCGARLRLHARRNEAEVALDWRP